MGEYGWLVLLVVLAALGLAVLALARWIRRRLRGLARAAFGVSSLRQGLAQQADRLAYAPKSISGMTEIYLPQIVRDFPQFDWPQFRQQAENTLRAALLAISAGDEGMLADADAALREQVHLRLEDLRQRGLREIYEDICIHRTEITRYRKERGICTVTLQSAVGHRQYTLRGDAVVAGEKDRPRQTKYNLELAYVQDAQKAGVSGASVGLVCPHCGAPVTQLGQKVCEYCGMGQVELNLRAWALHRLEEV